MPKYLARISLNTEGVRSLQKDMASGRRAAAAKFTEAAGGKLETMYFAFGEDDILVIADLPDNAAAAALSVAASAGGLAKFKITPLLTIEEMDRAIEKSHKLVPPGR